MRFPGFVGGSYVSQSAFLAGERTVNMYPGLLPTDGGKASKVLLPCPGFTTFATGLSTPGRGLFGDPSDRLFAVFGTHVYEVDQDGTTHDRGQVLLDGNPATISANGNDELLVTSGTKGYRLDMITGAVAPVVDDVTVAGVVDGFGVALDAVTGTLKISEEDDFSTWDPLQVIQRSSAPDPWVAKLIIDREIYLFGRKTGEVFFNDGGSPFPFAQRPGSFFEIGVEASFSLAPFGTSLAFLGRSERGSGRVYQMNGYTPVPISTEAVEWAIEQYKANGAISDAIGWSYEAVGHAFYVLEFPTAGKTWVYDGTVDKWHERGRFDSDAKDYLPYRARFHAELYRKNLVCDSQSGKIYALSSSIYTDVDGMGIRRLRRVPHLSNENRRMFLDYAELECVRGVGLTAPAQGSDPMMMFRTSWNGGGTWGAERWRSLGKKGKFSQRVLWTPCGSGRDLVMEFACSDPVLVAMSDLYVGIS